MIGDHKMLGVEELTDYPLYFFCMVTLRGYLQSERKPDSNQP